jgi:hypothetical protein
MIARKAVEGMSAPETLATRNAVETAIELSKLDRKSTWEGAAIRLRPSIKPWDSAVRPEISEEPRA